MSYIKYADLPDGASIFCDDGRYYCVRGWHPDPCQAITFDTPEAARMAWEMSDKPDSDTIGAIYAKHLGESMRASIDAAIHKLYQTGDWKEMHTK